MTSSATAVAHAEPQVTPYKLWDERGLHLIVVPDGSSRWRFDYRYEGKRRTMSFDIYPGVTLADACRALIPAKVTHRAAIPDPKQVGELLRAIDGHEGCKIVRIAPLLFAHLFSRPGELRLANDCAAACEAEYRYAESVAELIPHMIAAFLDRDRGVTRRNKM